MSICYPCKQRRFLHEPLPLTYLNNLRVSRRNVTWPEFDGMWYLNWWDRNLPEEFNTLTKRAVAIDFTDNNNNNNNNNNNYKTFVASLSPKWIELSDAPITGVGETHSPGTMQSSATVIRWQGNLGKISESEKVSFQMVTERNYAIWWLNIFRELIPKSKLKKRESQYDEF